MLIKIIALIVSLYGCASFSHNQFNPRSQEQSPNDLFPGNYTTSQIIQTGFIPANILASPDQNWIIYQDREETYSNSTTIYYRHRKWTQAKSIKLGQQRFDNFMAWTFNQKGDQLFVGTYYGYVYRCKFGENMTSEDCSTKVGFNVTGSYYTLRLNEVNQLAMSIRNQVWVFELSEKGEFKQLARANYSGMPWLNVEWHPQLWDIVIVGTCNSSVDKSGLISFLNITSNSTQDRVIQTCITQMVLLTSDSIIIALTTKNYLDAFVINDKNVTSITVNKEISAEEITTSQKGDIFIAFKKGQLRFQAYSVQKLISHSQQTKHVSQNQDNPKSTLTGIMLNSISIQYCNQPNQYAFSLDANEYYLCERYQPKITIYSMCTRGTYFSEDGCPSCTNDCATCHFTSHTCTNCIDDTFALFQDQCIACGQFLSGCLNCQSVQICLSCDKNAGFNQFPVSGKCVCQDFHYILEGQCKPCDTSGACRICKSQTECTQCDLYKGYKEKPVNSTCACRKQFSTVNKTCIECDIEGCSNCQQSNTCKYCQSFFFNQLGKCKPCDSYNACITCQSQTNCSKCDIYKGYQLTPVDFKCVCQKQFIFANETCVKCGIQGCDFCEKVDMCLFCSEEKGYEPDAGIDGVCIRNNAYSIVVVLSIIGGIVVISLVVFVTCKYTRKTYHMKDELKEELYLGEQRKREQYDKIRIQDVPMFEQIEQILHQSIQRQIKLEAPIAAINKKEYAKFSDAQKIRLRQLLKESLVSN